MLQDGLLPSVLWQTCFRGFDAGRIRLNNIVLPTGGNAEAFLVLTRKLPATAATTMSNNHAATASTSNGNHCYHCTMADVCMNADHPAYKLAACFLEVVLKQSAPPSFKFNKSVI